MKFFFPLLNCHPYPLAFLLRLPILFLDTLLEFTICPVEQDLCTLAGYQQTLHLVHRRTPVLIHCGILSIPQSLCWREKKIKAITQNKQWSCIHSCGLSVLDIENCTLSSLTVHCGLQFRGVNVNPIFLYIFPFG